jgi:hypothetical protein
MSYSLRDEHQHGINVYYIFAIKNNNNNIGENDMNYSSNYVDERFCFH